MLRNPPFSMGASSQEQYRYSPSVWPSLTTLRTMCEALREGLAMHRQYEVLRSKGFAHDAALRQALAIGAAPSQRREMSALPAIKATRAARGMRMSDIRLRWWGIT